MAIVAAHIDDRKVGTQFAGTRCDVPTRSLAAQVYIRDQARQILSRVELQSGKGVVISLHEVDAETCILQGGAQAALTEVSRVSDEATSEPTQGEPLSDEKVRLVLRRVKDPEVNLNIVDMGLIYGVTVEDNNVTVDMSLTSPGCPSGPEIMHDAEEQLKSIPGIGAVVMNLVWSPPWTPERIEPRVRAYLGF